MADVVQLANESLQNLSQQPIGRVFSNVFEGFLSQFVFAVLIIIIGLFVGMFAGKFLQKILHEMNVNQIIKQTTGKQIRLDHFVALIASWIIYFLTVILALNQVGITSFILNSVSIFILLLVLFLILLGLKDIVPNVITGMYIHMKNLYSIGDTVKTPLAEGKIISSDLLESQIETTKKDLLIVPHSYLLTKCVLVKRAKRSSKKE